jgi:WD40 repeat protein
MFGPVFSELQESPHIPKMNLHRLGINAAACLALLTAFVIDRAPVSAKGDKGLDGGPDAIPRGALARLGTDRFRHPNSACVVAISPNGEAVASGDDRGRVCIWDASTGRLLARTFVKLSSMTSSVVALHFCPDSRSVAVAVRGGVCVWRWSTNDKPALVAKATEAPTLDKRFQRHVNISSLAISNDGKIATFGDASGTIHIWNLTRQEEMFKIVGERPPPDDDIRCPVALAPGGKVLAFPRLDGSVHLWQVGSNREVQRLPGNSAQVISLAFSPDGGTLAAGGDDGRLHLSDLATMTQRWSTDLNESPIYALAYSADGRTIVAGTGRGRVQFFDCHSGRKLRQFEGNKSGVTSLAISPSNNLLLGAGEDERLWRWDLETGKELEADTFHRAKLNSIAFSPDERFVATCSDDGTARLWETANGKPWACFRGHTGRVRTVAYSPDGITVATGADDGTVRLWEARPEAPQRFVFQKHMKGISKIAFCQGNRAVASMDYKGQIRIWQPTSGLELLALARTDAGNGMLSSPVGPELAIAGLHAVEMLDAVDGDSLYTIPAPTDSSYFLAFAYCATGRLLAVSFDDGTIRVVEQATGQLVVSLTAPPVLEGRVSALAFAARDRILAAGTENGSVYLYDVSTTKSLPPTKSDSGAVMALASTKDGELLACAYSNGTALIWNISELAPKELIPRSGPAGHAGSPEPVRSNRLNALWSDLTARDATVAYKAIHCFTSSPEESVAFLRDRLRPVIADSTRIPELMMELNDNRYEVRRRAYEALEKMGDVAIPQLRALLSNQPSLEQRIAAKKLLAQAKQWTAEDLRALRATVVLEFIGTADARLVLQRLAEGSPESRATGQARAAVERLDRLSRTAP